MHVYTYISALILGAFKLGKKNVGRVGCCYADYTLLILSMQARSAIVLPRNFEFLQTR